MALTIIIDLTNTVFICPVHGVQFVMSHLYYFQYRLFWCVGGWSDILCLL